jgi:hypothetical protein
MKLSSSTCKKLVGINNEGKVKNIGVKVFRKTMDQKKQRRIGDKLICVVCNYGFNEGFCTWSTSVKAICHPFRKYKDHPGKIKMYDFAESDLSDKSWKHCQKPRLKKRHLKWDFVLFTLDSSQGVRCKGFHTVGLINDVARDLNLKGLIVDYYGLRNQKYESCKKAKSPSYEHQLGQVRKTEFHSNVEFRREAFTDEQIKDICESTRFVVFPNTRDASPKLITEVLIRGTPVLINENIYGGWKYADGVLGLSFDSAPDYYQLHDDYDNYLEKAKNAFDAMMKHKISPTDLLKHYYSKYGLVHAAKKLAAIVNDIEGGDYYKYVMYSQLIDTLVKIT